MTEPSYKIDMLWGVMELKPVEFKLALKEAGWFIETEFASLGPIASREEAEKLLALTRCI